MDKLKLAFYKFNEYQELDKLKDLYTSRSDIELIFVEGEEVLTFRDPLVILFIIKSKEDLQKAVMLLKQNKNSIKEGTYKFAAVLSKRNSKVEKVLTRFGCSDYLTEDIKPRSLSFKVDFWKKNILAVSNRKKSQDFSDNKTDSKETSSAQGQNQDESRFLPAMKGTSDIWLLKEKRYCRKVLNKWLISFIGPSPRVVKWTEIMNRPNEWLLEWESLDDQTEFDSKGTWVFEGSKPEFDWKEKRWLFTSRTPALYFESGLERDYRVSSTVKTLSITEDSQAAEGKMELFTKSASTEFSIEGEAEKKDNSESAFDGEDKINTKMEGKGSTDKINSKMKGEDKSSSGDIAEPLVGKVKKNDSGYIDEEAHESKFEERKLEDFKGKSKTDKIDSGPLVGESKEKAEKKSDLYGEFESEKKNSSPLVGSFEAESKKKKEHKESKYSEETASGLSGESKTDHLDHSPLVGELKPSAESKNGKEQKAQKAESSDLHPSLSGEKKSSEETRSEAQQGMEDSLADNQGVAKKEAPEEKQSQKDFEKEITEEGETSVRVQLVGENTVQLCHLEDFFEDEISLSSTDAFDEEADYIVTVSYDYAGSKVTIKSPGKIIDSDDGLYVFKLEKVTKEESERFMALYEERQSKITEFMSLAKGA